MTVKGSLLDLRKSFQSCEPLKCTKLPFDTYSVSHNKMIVSQITTADVDVSTSCVLLRLSWWFQSGHIKQIARVLGFVSKVSKTESS